jgi:seryl-tRNA synthetase
VDLKFIRENPELAKATLMRRNEGVNIETILKQDQRRREVIVRRDDARRRQKLLSEKVGQLRRAGMAADAEMMEARSAAVTIKNLEEELNSVEVELASLMQFVPNHVHESVTNEDTVVAEWGELPKFDFAPKAHWDLATALDILDFETASKLSGSRFVLFKGRGALLERALINYCLDTHTQRHGYTEISPPFLCLEECFYGTGSLPKQADEMYRFKEDPFYLIPTAEVPLVNMHRGETLNESELPKYYVAYTPCFRREAGSYGKDVRGMIRVHQFDKVELVKFTTPETSYDEMEKLRANAETILRALNIPYRVKRLAASEMAFQSAKTYDLDAFAAGVGNWLEVSSISNCEEFQARRANIRFRRKGGGADYVHIMNGSGLAFPRIFVCLVENNQQSDGSIVIPEVLRPYMGGLERIGSPAMSDIK